MIGFAELAASSHSSRLGHIFSRRSASTFLPFLNRINQWSTDRTQLARFVSPDMLAAIANVLDMNSSLLSIMVSFGEREARSRTVFFVDVEVLQLLQLHVNQSPIRLQI